ncbi:MAG: DUF3768 domain-containing protein [Pseudomonadota bacterium]
MERREEPIAGAIGAVPRCQTCGSERVVKGACACWNPETVLDAEYCRECEAPTTFVWSPADPPPKQRIRELNDRFRREGRGQGSVMITSGLQEQGAAFVAEALAAVRNFDAFTADNDPWGEHDFGAVEIAGQRVFFKFDYYTPDLTAGSENPGNEGLTHRVLTIMLASEY